MFRFYNKAPGFDWKETEFSDFEKNMEPIAATQASCHMQWSGESVSKGLSA